MESHSAFASNKYLTKEGKSHQVEQWENLKNMLNALSSGPPKTVKQWQTVWHDLKSNTSKKASKIRNERNRTGNFPVNSEPLNNLEQRVVSCIGVEYIEDNSDCPDSVPEEEILQIQLEKGNEDVLNIPPSTTSINEILNNPTLVTEIQNDCDRNGNTVFTNISEVFDNENEANTSSSYIDVLHCVSDNQSSSQKENYNIQNRKRKTSNESSNGRKKQRIGEQLREARTNFTTIAENHAKALQLFAEAAKMSAENEYKRNTLEERRLLIEERRVNIDEQYITVLNKLLTVLQKFIC